MGQILGARLMAELITNHKLDDSSFAMANMKLLTFTLAEETYAINILNVQEIKSINNELNMTTLSDVPSHIMGIIALNEMIIPIVDLRIFFHIPFKKNNKTAAVILLTMENVMLGIIVDSVVDIIELSEKNIKQPPELFSLIHREYVAGIATYHDTLLIIIDVKKLILSDTLQIAKQISRGLK